MPIPGLHTSAEQPLFTRCKQSNLSTMHSKQRIVVPQCQHENVTGQLREDIVRSYRCPLGAFHYLHYTDES